MVSSIVSHLSSFQAYFVMNYKFGSSSFTVAVRYLWPWEPRWVAVPLQTISPRLIKYLHVKLVFSSKKGSTICSTLSKPINFMWTLKLLFSVVAFFLLSFKGELHSPLGFPFYNFVYQFSNKVNWHNVFHIQMLSNKVWYHFPCYITVLLMCIFSYLNPSELYIFLFL